MPASSDNFTEPAEYLDKLEQMQENVRKDLEEFSLPRELFAHPGELNPIEISNEEANLALRRCY